jgi:hypothetical protein
MDERHATIIDSRHKTGQVADHAAAKGDDNVIPVRAAL